MKLNGDSPMSWQGIAFLIASALLGIIIYIGKEIRGDVKQIRIETNEVQRKNDVQDQRLETVEAWLWRRSKSSGGAGP